MARIFLSDPVYKQRKMNMNIPRVSVEVQLVPRRQNILGDRSEMERFKKAVFSQICKKSDIQANTLVYSQELMDGDFEDIQSYVETVVISDAIPLGTTYKNVDFIMYTANQNGPEAESLQMGDDAGSSEDVMASNHWILPSVDFVGAWENLIFEKGVKEHILNYVETSMLFAKSQINTNLVSCNRIVLLHGPPGTGKTSLCRAVAQKVSITFQEHYKFFHLVEINSHSLFSKWFSESGKLVQKLFSQLRELVEHSSSMVCILIDEIESVAFSRSAISNNEPTDSIRAVNAILTQLDQIRKYSNVLILATSNLTSNIDVAFLDRADIKQFIGPPSDLAIYRIYITILNELIRVGLAKLPENRTNYRMLSTCMRMSAHNLQQYQNYCPHELIDLIMMSKGVSGRTLRKIPMLAHAYFMEKQPRGGQHDLMDFIKGMRVAIMKHTSDTECVNQQNVK